MLLLYLTSSCASSPVVKEEPVPSEKEIKAKIMNEKLDKQVDSTFPANIPLKTASYSNDYAIGPGDLLEISVFGVEELKGATRVSSTGFVSLPLIGKVKVKGLTSEDLEKELTTRLKEKYLQDPQVTVFIKEYTNNLVSVMGAVGKPGSQLVVGKKYLLDVLATAGGISKDAGSICYIIRENKEEEYKKQNIIINLDNLLIKGETDLNIQIEPGDMVNIPVPGVVYVQGEVEKPGAYTLINKMTALNAIAVAQGLKFSADESEIKLLRFAKDGEKKIIPINYSNIEDGTENDIRLEANDIIVIPRSGVKAFLSSLFKVARGAFTFGSFSAGF